MIISRYQRVFGAAFVIALKAAAADTVSFNFASSIGTTVGAANNTIGAAETAGATGYNFANWNNLLSDYGGNVGAIPNPILDSNGVTVTGMTISYDAPNAWNNGIATTTGDLKLMRNYLDSGTTDSPSVQITAAPYRKFDLVVYADGDGVAGQTLGPYVVRFNNTGTQFANQTEAATNVGNLLRAPVWLKETGNFSGTYTLVDTAASLSVAGAQSGNYMVFSGLKGTINLDPTQTTSVSRSPLNGFQIVKWETANVMPGGDDPAAKIALYSGEVTVAANRTIGSVATSVGTYGDLVINPGVTLTLANGDLDMGDINHWVKGGGSLTSGTSTLTIHRDISAGFSYVSNSADVAVNGATIVDNGGAVGVRKTGGGKLRMQSANPYTGATILSQGSIEIGNAAALGNSATAVTLNDAGTSFFSTALYLRNGITLNRNIVVANAGAASSTSTLGSLEAGTGTYSGTVTLNKTAQMDVVAGSTITVSGAVSGAGGVVKTSPGTVVMSVANSYSGGTEVLGGTLSSGALSGIGSGYLAVKSGALFRYTGTGSESTARTLWFDNGASTFEITNASGSLSWSSPLGTRSQSFTKTGAGSLALDAVFSAGASITVNGGTLVLSSANTYSGVTNVNGGKLLVNGTHTGGGLITVAAGATLGGSGSVGDVTVADSGILAPGNSAGNLTVSSLTLNPAAVLDFELDAPSPAYNPLGDFVTVGGNLTLTGVINVTPLGGFGTPAGGEKWLLMSYSGTLTDNGLSVGSAPALAANLSYLIDTSSANQVFLSVVPEAGSGVLAVLGLLLLLRRRR